MVNNKFIIKQSIVSPKAPVIIPITIVLVLFICELSGTKTPEAESVLYPAYNIVEIRMPDFFRWKTGNITNRN